MPQGLEHAASGVGLLAGLFACAVLAQTAAPELGDQHGFVLPTAKVMTDHEQLREFVPTGELIETVERGRLTIEIRKSVVHEDATGYELEPASVTVRYRNRLLAAATGYRLGGSAVHNGVLIESWDGGDDCLYSSWRLQFAGERLVVAESSRNKASDCQP